MPLLVSPLTRDAVLIIRRPPSLPGPYPAVVLLRTSANGYHPGITDPFPPDPPSNEKMSAPSGATATGGETHDPGSFESAKGKGKAVEPLPAEMSLDEDSESSADDTGADEVRSHPSLTANDIAQLR